MRPVSDPQVPDFVKRLQGIETYAEITEIMKSPDFEMAGAEERTIFLGDSLIMVEGERHAELKRTYAKLFTREAIAYYELKSVDPAIRKTIDEMRAQIGADGRVRIDAVSLVHRALTRISAEVTGIDGVDTAERTERFRRLVLDLSAATTASYSSATDPALIIQKGHDAIDALVAEFMQSSLDRRIDLVARHRAGEIAAAELPRDLLTSLALAGDLSRPDDDGRVGYIWRQCALLLTGSIKTTSHSLPHAFIHIDEWIKAHPQDRSKLTDPEWLHRAAAESFRLHQTTPARFRRATRDVVLSTGRRVAAGEMVALHAPRANVSTEVFGEDGRVFNPNRVVPSGMRPWGMTFGIGIHACIGQNLVTGLQNRGDERHGTHGTAVRLLKAMYDIGAELDPENPPRRPHDDLHDTWESVPMIVRAA